MKNEILNKRLDGVVIGHSASVKIDQTGTGKNDPAYKINFHVSFDGWTVEQVLSLAMRTLVISAQRVWRTMTVEQIKAVNGKTINASDMGKKPKNVVDVESSFKAMFARMSAEEQAAKIAELQKLIG